MFVYPKHCNAIYNSSNLIIASWREISTFSVLCKLHFVQSIPVWLLLGLKGLFQCGQRALSSGHTLLRGLGCSPSDHVPVASVPWRLSEARHAEVQLQYKSSNTRMAPNLYACMDAGDIRLVLHKPSSSRHKTESVDIVVMIHYEIPLHWPCLATHSRWVLSEL